jgi:hypothetical protein
VVGVPPSMRGGWGGGAAWEQRHDAEWLPEDEPGNEHGWHGGDDGGNEHMDEESGGRFRG